MNDLIDFLKFIGILIIVIGSSIACSIWLVLALNSAECSAYGRQTGREVVFDWSCYARDDSGKMIPAEQIDKKLEVTVK